VMESGTFREDYSYFAKRDQNPGHSRREQIHRSRIASRGRELEN
jgi:hypothetical protein